MDAENRGTARKLGSLQDGKHHGWKWLEKTKKVVEKAKMEELHLQKVRQ